jgi:peptidoglycan/LPS O-acetylase OafA/YrhL
VSELGVRSELATAGIPTPRASSVSERSPSPFRYRADIDALRGLAVLAVFLFHLDENWLPGGFTGVDIFLVISGYVVTGSLLHRSREPLGPRLGGFYLRRIRRLLPNLLLTIGVTSVLVALLVPPTETKGIFLTAVKALYGWSNNHLLARADDYFGLDASLNPFLHTWTLGVEEQFYLVFPLLMAALGMDRRRALPLLTGTIALSLAFSFWWSAREPMAAFFLMPSRFWEMALGAALLLAQRRGLLAGWIGGRWLRLAGILLLLASLRFSSEHQGFPVPGALPAVVGTVMVLQASPGPDGRFLPVRWLETALVACGLLSYSLYLWHWPVMTLMRWTVGMDLPWQKLLAVAVSFLLAWLAFRFVERPVRSHPLPAPAQVILALVALVGSWVGIDALAYPHRGALFLGNTSDPVPAGERIGNLVPVIPGTQITDINCAVGTETTYSITSRADFELCSKAGLEGAAEIFLIGDSHAHHLLPMLDLVTEQTGQRISFTFKNSCLISPDLTVSFNKERYEPCRQFAAGEMERTLERLKSGDVVLISSWLNQQLGDIDSKGDPRDFPVYKGNRRLSPVEVRRSYINSTRAFARRLAERGINLVLMVDIPELVRAPVVCESWASLQKDGERSTLCAPPASVTTRMQNLQRETLASIAAGMDNVHVFDPTPYLLLEGKVRHRSRQGTVLYSDNHHLSVSGSRMLAIPFQAFLQEKGLARP